MIVLLCSRLLARAWPLVVGSDLFPSVRVVVMTRVRAGVVLFTVWEHRSETDGGSGGGGGASQAYNCLSEDSAEVFELGDGSFSSLSDEQLVSVGAPPGLMSTLQADEPVRGGSASEEGVCEARRGPESASIGDDCLE